MKAPWQIMAVIMSLMARFCITSRRSGLGLNGRNSVFPSQIDARSAYPESDECMPTSTPASCTRAQNGSNSGRPGDRGPRRPQAGAGRIRMHRAPRSRHHSNSSMAFSTMGRVMMGVAKIRSW